MLWALFPCLAQIDFTPAQKEARQPDPPLLARGHLACLTGRWACRASHPAANSHASVSLSPWVPLFARAQPLRHFRVGPTMSALSSPPPRRKRDWFRRRGIRSELLHPRANPAPHISTSPGASNVDPTPPRAPPFTATQPLASRHQRRQYQSRRRCYWSQPRVTLRPRGVIKVGRGVFAVRARRIVEWEQYRVISDCSPS
jgi:hypothetical protein